MLNNQKIRIIIKDRGKGKTTGLLYTSETTGYPIIVKTTNQVNVLKQKAKDLNISIPTPLTISEIRTCRGENEVKCVPIDEAYDIIGDALDYYIGGHVVAATMSDYVKN